MDAEVEEAEGSAIHKNHDDDAPDGSTRQDQPSTSMESVAARTRSRLAKAEAGRSGKGVQTRGSRKRGASADEIVTTTGGPACRKRARSAGTGVQTRGSQNPGASAGKIVTTTGGPACKKRARSAGTGKAARSDDSSSKVTEGDQENAIDLDSLLKQMETAVKEDNPTHLESILNQGQGHIRRHQVKRAFLVCVNKGLHRCAEVFIDADFQPSLNLYKDGSGKYPLMRATEQKDVQMVKVLTKKPFDTELVHEADGKTPLHVAVEEESLAMVKSLVEAGFDVNAEWVLDGTTRYALGMAMAIDKNLPDIDEIEIALWLICCGADCNRLYNCDFVSAGWTPLMWCLLHNYEELFDFILGRTSNLDIQDQRGQTALLFAVEGNLVDHVRMLLARGANPNLKGQPGYINLPSTDLYTGLGKLECWSASPFFTALELDHYEIAKLLLETGKIDVNEPEGYVVALGSTIDKLDDKMVKLLLDNGADPHSVYRDLSYGPQAEEQNCFYIALFTQMYSDSVMPRVNILEYLFQAGSNLDWKTSDGLTPLMLAVWGGYGNEVIAKLIQFGVDPDYHGQDVTEFKVHGGYEGLEGPVSSALDLAVNEACEDPIMPVGPQHRTVPRQGMLLLVQVGASVKQKHIEKVLGNPDFAEHLQEVEELFCNPRSLEELCIYRIRRCLGLCVRDDSTKLGLPKILVEHLNFAYIPVFQHI